MRGSSGLAPGRCSRCERGHAAGAERRAVVVAVEHGEPERVAIEVGEPVEIARLQADRADVQRRAAREGRGAEGLGASMWRLISVIHIGPGAGQPGQGRRVARRPVRSAIALAAMAGAGLAGRREAPPCPSIPPPSAASRISRASRLADDEIEHLQGELNAMLAFVEQLSEVNVEGVEPMTSVTPMAMKKRADVVTDGGIADDIVKNAPATEDHFFLVPKVVE